MRFTVADCVAANARAFPDRVAIEVLHPRDSGTTVAESWTYGAVWQRVCALAAAIGPDYAGGRVAILLPNSADHVFAYLAVMVTGSASVPVNSRLAGAEIDFVLTDSASTVIITGHEFLVSARAAAERVGARVINVAMVPETAADPWVGPTGDWAGSEIAMVSYTSGTTGFPKGAAFTNDALLTRFAQWGWTFGLSPDEVLSIPGPLFHGSYGGLALAHLVSGGRSRIMSAFEPNVALDEYANESSWVFLVPSMLAMVAEAWDTAGRPSLPRLRCMLSSGAPGPMSLLDRAFDVFPNARIIEAYGWTEGGWVTYEVKDRAALVPHSVGWPTLGSELIVIDPDSGRRLGVGEPGEVCARSIVPFVGYLNNSEATNAANTDDGFLRSGDVGVLLADGRLTIVDRVKDMIITGGENVYCAEVERVLVEHPAVLESAVVGLPDEMWGERVVGAVVLRPGAAATPADLIEFARLHLAHYKCPKQINVLDALPRNPMGKVQKFRLVELL